MIQTDGELLLATILDPTTDTDGARLAYSDWLEEEGKDERAEFIRVQCRIHWLDNADSRRDDCITPGQVCDDPDCPAKQSFNEERALHLREQELFRQSSETHSWFGRALAFTLAGTRWIDLLPWFRRGLLHSVTCQADDWIDRADAVLKTVPVRHVRLTKWPGLSTLFPSPTAQRLRKRMAARESEFVRRQLTVSQMVAELFATEWPGVTFTLPKGQP